MLIQRTLITLGVHTLDQYSDSTREIQLSLRDSKGGFSLDCHLIKFCEVLNNNNPGFRYRHQAKDRYSWTGS